MADVNYRLLELHRFPIGLKQNPLQLLNHLWEGVSYGLALLEVLKQEQTFRYVAANSKFAAMSSVDIEHLIGQTLNEALPTETTRIYHDCCWQCIHSNQPITFEQSFDRNGQKSWWQITINPLKNQDEQIDQVLISAIDISDRIQTDMEQQQAYATLAKSEAKFRHLVENANDLITTWTLDGTITYLSPGFYTLYGHSPDKWVGRSFAPLAHPDDLPGCLMASQQAVETGKKHSGIEFRRQYQQGNWLWSSINMVPIQDADGKITSVQGIIRDIHASKQQQAALRFIVEETVSKTGDEFFRSCVRSLSEIFQTQYAFITQCTDQTYSQCDMLVFWTGQVFAEPYTFNLAKTPCEYVLQNKVGLFLESLQTQFPDDPNLATLQAESYLGAAITDSQGQAIGTIGVIDTRHFAENVETAQSILQLFAARVGVEMERNTAEAALREYAERQALINRLTNQIRNSLDVNSILETTIQELYTLLQVDWCAFTWYDPSVTPAVWKVVADQSHHQSSLVGSCSPDLIGSTDEIIPHLDTIRIDQAESYQEPSHRASLMASGVQSRLCVPIQTQREQIGMILCDHQQQQHTWTDREVELVQAVADQLAIAINQADLYEQSRSKSKTLQATLKELRQTQAQMIQSEKMSSLGQLVAGIAHEINNPVNFIHGNVNYVDEYARGLLELVTLYQQSYPESTDAISEKIEDLDLDFVRHDLPKLLDSMQVGTERIREIVKSLRLFSRLDESEFKPVNLHDGIESTLMILQNRLKSRQSDSEIEVIKNYGALPLIECFAGQLNQVFMNILTNAIDAVEEKRSRIPSHPATIQITTAVTEDQQAIIRFADNGIGIPESIQAQIFDPFFTTKPIGQGTGMGMSISYQIVTEKHRGQIICHSTPDHGTEFVIQIPIHQIRPQQ
ncbi:PAS domain S-box protein [Leptolyngbya sp. GGD]|uniref:PAS domain S-box protein n=1 Tax=Leptolyngbya sp. GGD TaxID=2997907 RepID=UPI00227C85A5|nr:PAS domain S-box protein [Leptolyngbya sp. GGD]MCY6490159.1 PAS domain S-box protein [Leptolyngbya sp. GGD]